MKRCKDDHAERYQGQVDRVTLDEARLILSWVQERSHSAGNVAQHDLRAGGSCTLAIARVVGVEPGDVETKSDVDASSYEEATEVEDAGCTVAEKNAVADDGDSTSGGGDGTTELQFVGQPGQTYVCQGSRKIARHCEKLSDCASGIGHDLKNNGRQEGAV